MLELHALNGFVEAHPWLLFWFAFVLLVSVWLGVTCLCDAAGVLVHDEPEETQAIEQALYDYAPKFFNQPKDDPQDGFNVPFRLVEGRRR